jgi:hypothetical protein
MGDSLLEQFQRTNPKERDAFSILVWQGMDEWIENAIESGLIPRAKISVSFELQALLRSLIRWSILNDADMLLYHYRRLRALDILQKNKEFSDDLTRSDSVD